MRFSSDTRFCCPCCGYPTLTERGGFEICECGYEDDGNDDENPDAPSGPNGELSLNQMRDNYQKFGLAKPSATVLASVVISDPEVAREWQIKEILKPFRGRTGPVVLPPAVVKLLNLIEESEIPRLPCPYCSHPLVTNQARQCHECGMDWHDPMNIINHKSSAGEA